MPLVWACLCWCRWRCIVSALALVSIADDIGGSSFGRGGCVAPRGDTMRSEAVTPLVGVPHFSVLRGKAGGAADLRGPARQQDWQAAL